LRTNFFELLGELNNLDETSEWRKVKGSLETDKRYELVGSSSKREQFFNDYIKELAEKKNPETEKEDAAENEKEEGEKDEKDEETKDEGTKDQNDEKAKEAPQDEEADEDRKLDEKYERMEASLRKREEEVRAQKELYEKDREKERGIHMHDKAVQHFNALLADMVKDTQYTWKETRRTLRKDPRWSALDVLDKETKESLFEEHIKDIGDKRKRSFRRLLEEADVPLDAYWRDVRRQIKDDPRYAKFGNSEKREEQFEVYIREKTTTARNDFRELLRETKTITYKSKKLVDESNSYWKDIKEVLKKDKRYHVMSSLANERDRLIMSYISELHKRGPPPPPTATNPAARYKTD